MGLIENSSAALLHQILKALQGICKVLEEILQATQANGAVLRDIKARLP